MTMSGASRRCVATVALMACGHCGDLRRVRTEGQFVSCDSCGKVLQEQGGRKQHAVVAEARRQLRRRRWLGTRKRKGYASAADAAAAGAPGGEDMVFVGREGSDAESGTAGARFGESSSS
uniref:Uncharacterized protein n=1 Tax=Avena sativa TaxID=4498 RepID=A0ACD5TAM7_AVESA